MQVASVGQQREGDVVQVELGAQGTESSMGKWSDTATAQAAPAAATVTPLPYLPWGTSREPNMTVAPTAADEWNRLAADLARCLSDLDEDEYLILAYKSANYFV